MSQTSTTGYYQEQVMKLFREKSDFFYLGIISILLVGGTFFTVFNQKSPGINTSSRIANEYIQPTPTSLQQTYIIKETDSLSTIAMAYLGDGDKWVDIAKLNNITDPNTVTAGMKILLPTNAAPMSPAPSPTPTQSPVDGQIEPQGDVGTGAMTKRANPSVKEYTVQEGEGLWQIAEKVYGDGEMWVAIMNENQLTNPDQIYTGLKLKMPHIK